MPRVATGSIVGMLCGLLLAFGVAAIVATYISGPGRPAVRSASDNSSNAALPTWPDPNAGMRHKEDRVALMQMIERQDAESLKYRGVTHPDTSLTDEALTANEKTADGQFQIELRPKR